MHAHGSHLKAQRVRTALAAPIGIVVVTLGSFLGCSRGPSIRAIVQNPSRYQDSVVTLSGTAAGPQGLSLGGAGVGMYTLVDGADSIRVISSAAPPAERQRVRVTGSVRAAMAFGLLRFGPVLEETSREGR